MTDEHEDRIRDALRTEADGVEASPNLLDRINAEASTPEAPSGPSTRWLAVAAAFIVVAGALGVLVTRDGGDQRLDAARGDPVPAMSCDNPDPVFDSRYELGVYPWQDATEEDWAALQQWLADDQRVTKVERVTREDAYEAYASWDAGDATSIAGDVIAAQLLVDLREDVDLRSLVADLKTLPEVRHPTVFCRGFDDGGDGLPPSSQCPPYDLLFLLTDVVTPPDLAAFEQRFQADPRVASYQFVPAADTYEGRAPEFRVELTSDPGTGEPAPDDTEVRNDIGRLHGTAFVLERSRCRPDPATPTAAADVPMPSVLAVVSRDGRLIRVDLASGEQTLLSFQGNPDVLQESGSRSYIVDVDISPDGRWAYYSTCCGLGGGDLYLFRESMVDPPNGVLEEGNIGTGRGPTISPDGTVVATIEAGGSVSLFAAEPAAPHGDPPHSLANTSVAGRALTLAWSPDGRQLAVLVISGGLGESGIETWHVEVFDVAGGVVEAAGGRTPVQQGIYPGWSADGELVLVAQEYGPPALDASRQWELSIEEGGGAVFARRVGEARGTLLEVEGGPFVDADW